MTTNWTTIDTIFVYPQMGVATKINWCGDLLSVRRRNRLYPHFLFDRMRLQVRPH
jgi:hypothetical protein